MSQAGGRSLGALGVLIVAALASGSCGGDSQSLAHVFEVRDSAGVAIASNAGQPGRWSVSTSPELDIGDLSQGAEYQLFQVRDVATMPDGRVLIANDGSREIRVYSADGEFLEAWGGHGEGPGEFLSVIKLAHAPDGGILVWDGVRNVITRFDSDGAFLSSTPMGVGFVGAAWTVDLFADGRMLVPVFDGFGVDTSDGLYRRPLQFVVYDPAADRTVDYGSWDGPETYVETAGTSVRASILAFGGAADGTVSDDGRVHIALGTVPEMRTFDDAGALTRVVRWDAGPDLPADAVIAASRERALANADDAGTRAFIEAQYDVIPEGRTLPVMVSLAAGPDGEVWSQRFSVANEGPWLWDVFDAAGAHLAVVEMPSDFRPTEIGVDYVVGITRDAMEVEHVLRFGLNRTGS